LSLHQMMACTNCILSLRGRKWLETAQASWAASLANKLVFFHHAENFDAGSRERLLKDFSSALQKQANNMDKTHSSSMLLLVSMRGWQ
jgi:hypothetical protein